MEDLCNSEGLSVVRVIQITDNVASKSSGFCDIGSNTSHSSSRILWFIFPAFHVTAKAMIHPANMYIWHPAC